jgi:hypothetical protein
MNGALVGEGAYLKDQVFGFCWVLCHELPSPRAELLAKYFDQDLQIIDG